MSEGDSFTLSEALYMYYTQSPCVLQFVHTVETPLLFLTAGALEVIHYRKDCGLVSFPHMT